PQWVRVLCYVTHNAGHSRTYHVDMPADGKGAKGGDVMTLTHASGAALSYGMRYLLKMVWNIAVGEDDRDGNDEQEIPTPPKGFLSWRGDIEATADEGQEALKSAWQASALPFREFMVKHFKREWEALK